MSGSTLAHDTDVTDAVRSSNHHLPATALLEQLQPLSQQRASLEGGEVKRWAERT